VSVPDKNTRLARVSSVAPVPRKRKKLRKDDIVVEATRLFAERGYEGASMGDLAERVGLRKASLFHHFPSKDALYATVLEQLLEGIKVAILEASMAEGAFDERLVRLSDAITAQLGAQPHAARLLVREAMDGGPVMRDRLAGAIDAVLHAALEFARAGQREGAFSPDMDMTQVIVSLMGMFIMPFAVAEVTERFIGTPTFASAFIEARKDAIRSQVACMMVGRRKK
jgi:TetR/AcrR family transcriptional regulator